MDESPSQIGLDVDAISPISAIYEETYRPFKNTFWSTYGIRLSVGYNVDISKAVLHAETHPEQGYEIDAVLPISAVRETTYLPHSFAL